MGKRRSGRELAFRLLFQIDVGGGKPQEVLAAARIASEATPEVWHFAREVALGAWDRRIDIDPYIVKYASGWTLERIANVDRNLLRLAIYEILFRNDIPQGVSINEAVELAKEYSTAESARFINGILGSFAREHGNKVGEKTGDKGQQTTEAADVDQTDSAPGDPQGQPQP